MNQPGIMSKFTMIQEVWGEELRFLLASRSLGDVNALVCSLSLEKAKVCDFELGLLGLDF